MRRDLWSLGFALALGTIIGGLCADEIAVRFTFGSWFWAFGALFGGIVAWLAVDFRHFCAGVALAYRDTIAWRPDLLYWRTSFVVFGAYAVLFNSTIWIAAGIKMYFTGIGTGDISIIAFFLSAITTLLSFLMGCALASADNKTKLREEGWRWMRNCNPIGMLYWTIVGLAWVATRTPSAVVVVWRNIGRAYCTLRKFFIEVFINVQSERRMIALIFATAGAAVFHSFGSAIIGLIVGVVCGLLEYEIVRRWLKLVPARAK